jgi:hypothetical protein
MRLPWLALLAPTLVASAAAARPITIGAAAGITQAKVDANADPSTALSVFGRLGFNRHASAQLELQRIEDDANNANIRTGTLLVTLDLSDGKHLVPMVLAGAGIDSATSLYESTSGTHFEGGFALEYRADGGLVVGGDLRIGGRSLDQAAAKTYPVTGTTYFAPSQPLSDGEYRSARAYVGVRF